MVTKKGLFFVFYLCFGCCISVLPAAVNEPLFSETIASVFVKQASEVYAKDPLDSKFVDQAMVLLNAAYVLNNKNNQIPECMLQVAGSNCYVGLDNSQYTAWALGQYIGPDANLETAYQAVRCMLEELNSRPEREVFLDKMIRRYSSSEPAFISELSTQLGLLLAEKSDTQTALNFLAAAVQLNSFNQLAFSKLKELAGEDFSIPPSAELLRIRRAITLNPYDLESSALYADTLERMQIYDLAADAYKYAADVHHFLYPDRALAPEILHSWMLSCYHGTRQEKKCLEIAEKYRQSGPVDLVLEAIAGKTLIRLGQVDEGLDALKSVAQKAEALVSGGTSLNTIYPEYLAWFYSFVLDQPETALAWGNQAFLEDPNRPGVKDVFACCLALNAQYELAAQFVEPFKESDQIAAFTSALIQLNTGQNETALETLKATVKMAPETFVAEKATHLLKKNGSEYIPSVPPYSIQEEFENGYPFDVVPTFTPPSSRFSVKLIFNGSEFLYGDDFPARLVVENTSSDPIVISDGGMLNGNFCIDAVLEGGLNVRIPNLYATKYRPARLILPGKHHSIGLDLNRGRLRTLLLTYPQADLQINFIVYLNTLTSPAQQEENLLQETGSVQAQIHRRGVALSRDFLMQRLTILTKGQTGQKYQAASLFTGLLAEQRALERSRANVNTVQVEHELLVDSIRKLMVDDDWKIRIYTMNRLLTLSIQLEEGLLLAVSKNLNHDTWPVRLMAMFLLAKAQPQSSFQKVLDWMAQQDSNELNRRMAVAFGAKIPEPIQDTTDPNSLE